MRLLVGPHVEPLAVLVDVFRDVEPPPLALVQARLRVFPQVQDQIKGLPHHGPLVTGLWVEAEDVEISREASGADTPLEPPARQMIELGDPVGDHEGVVVGHAGDAGTEDDVLGQWQRHCDKLVRRGDVLPLRREVLADPRLLEPHPVQLHDLVEVIMKGLGDVGAGRVARHRKVADFH